MGAGRSGLPALLTGALARVNVCTTDCQLRHQSNTPAGDEHDAHPFDKPAQESRVRLRSVVLVAFLSHPAMAMDLFAAPDEKDSPAATAFDPPAAREGEFRGLHGDHVAFFAVVFLQPAVYSLRPRFCRMRSAVYLRDEMPSPTGSSLQYVACHGPPTIH